MTQLNQSHRRYVVLGLATVLVGPVINGGGMPFIGSHCVAMAASSRHKRTKSASRKATPAFKSSSKLSQRPVIAPRAVALARVTPLAALGATINLLAADDRLLLAQAPVTPVGVGIAPVGTPVGAPLSADVENAIVKALNDPRVTVKVMPRKDGKLVARLTGIVRNDAEVKAITDIVTLFVEQVISGLYTDVSARTLQDALNPPPIPDPAQEPTTDFWKLRVFNSSSPNLDGANSAADDITKVDDIKTALSAIYPKKDQTGAVQQVRDGLLLYGTPANILKMKRDLVRLDALGPQVQLDVSAIQLSGKGLQLKNQVAAMNTQLIEGRRLIQHLHGLLQSQISLHAAGAGLITSNRPFMENLPSPQSDDQRTAQLGMWLSKVGMNTDARRALSFSEMLIFLSTLGERDRRDVFDAVEENLRSRIATAQGAGWLDAVASSITDSPLRHLREVFGVPHVHLGNAEEEQIAKMAADGYRGNQGTLLAFLETLSDYKSLDITIATQGAKLPTMNDRHNKSILGVPESLCQQADIIDKYHAHIADAYARDVQEAIILPLIGAVGKNMSARGGGKASVAFLGQTRLIVTSGLQTTLKPTLTSSVNVTQSTPLTLSEVKSLKEGAVGAISGLTGTQAFFLGAALAPQPQAFATVAPGVGVAVRPTVWPNATGARLQIAASFGVKAKMPEQEKGSSNPQPPVLDAVESHAITTDANIDALDLIGLSSLDIDTRIPRGPFVVPILGRLPLLGPIFQFPRGDAEVHHNSVILVNTVILPRALDIARYYATGASNGG